jgi:hypothetical protein
MEWWNEMEALPRAGTIGPGGDAWGRAARRVRQLAAEAGVKLDEDELVLLDIRELHALSTRLSTTRNRRGWAAGVRLWIGGRLIIRPA